MYFKWNHDYRESNVLEVFNRLKNRMFYCSNGYRKLNI